MRRDEVYDAWAPRDSIWTPWAKPVLFAHLPPDAPGLPQLEPRPLPFTPPTTDRTAIVLNLPGAQAIPIALALAQAGYRPVPLYNAVPAPPGQSETVPVRPILDALLSAAGALARLALPPHAPPAFLLDADRAHGDPRPGDFDNRSISLPTDFPSAIFLRSAGIARVLLAQATNPQPPPDLAHTLRRYQENGIEIRSMPLAAAGPPTPVEIARPSLFRRAAQRFLAVLRLRRHPLGGFGGTLPEPSSG